MSDSISSSGAPTRGRRRRRHLSTALAVLFAFMFTTSTISIWAQDAVLDGTHLADTSVRLLGSQSVRAQLADTITEHLVEKGPSRLASFQTVLKPAIEQLLGTEVFRSIFRSAILRAQDSLLTESGTSSVINLSGALGVLSGSLQVSNPDLAASIPDGTSDLLVNVGTTLRDAQVWKVTQQAGEGTLRTVAILLAIGAAVVMLETDRRRGAFKLGVAIGIGGAVLLALALAAPAIAASFGHTPGMRAALHNGTSIILESLTSMSISLTAVGIIICAFAVATRPTRPPVTPMELLDAARSRSARWNPTTASGHVIRSLLVITVGYNLIVHRDAVAPLLVLLGGGYVTYLGVIELLSVVGRSDHRSVRSVVTEHLDDHVVTIRRHRILFTTLGLIVIVAGVAFLLNSRSHSAAAEAAAMRCNGHTELCDRHLDEVAFAGSHNSMSARRDPGWLFAEQDQGIPAQLSYGIRALLMKTHYGIPTGISVTGAPLVVTDQGAELATSVPESNGQLTEEQRRQAAAIATSAQIDPALRDVYLCHVNCELGATRFADALRYIRQFLDANPNEVILLVIGNYVSDSDTEKAFRDAKLFDRLWNVDPGAPMPTLREMIEARRNILMLAEFDAGQPAWNSSAYGIFQDTPYTFRTDAELFTPGSPRYTDDAVVDGPVPDTVPAPTPTDPAAVTFVPPVEWTGLPSCAPNRGTPTSPLFQINHWVTPAGAAPTAEQAKVVNAYDVLMPRVRDCMTQRGHLPNIIGVNFYDKGDLLRVVDEVNGVR
jgi:hypothetical protein